MSDAIELHDSYLLSVSIETGKVALNAVVHRFRERPESGMQWVDLTFTDLVVEGQPNEYPADIYGDELQISPPLEDGLIPCPYEHVGPVRLSLFLRDGGEISFAGSGLKVQAESSSGFATYFPE